MAIPEHGEASTSANLHRIGFVSDSDPGAVGAWKIWIEVDGSDNWVATHERDADNAGWHTIASASGSAPTGSAGGDLTGTYPNPTLGDVGTAGTFKSVTTDSKGRVTAGTNPTTLAGYGITDAIASSARGAANGVASLDASGLVPNAQIPPLAITKAVGVADQTARLALDAQEGDVAIQADNSTTYILKEGGDPTVDADWLEMSASGSGGVTSFNGRTGVVAPAANDYAIADISGLASVAANTILAGPTSGGSAAAAMRALVAADIPSLDAAKITTGVLAVARLATGTPDGTKFVRDDGTLAVPPGSSQGALVLLEQHTASGSASLDFTTGITSTYDTYVIKLVSLVLSAVAELYFRVSLDGGATPVTAADYYTDTFGWRQGGSGLTGENGGVKIYLTYPTLGASTASGWAISGSYHLYDPLSTTVKKHLIGSCRYLPNAVAAPQETQLSGSYLQAGNAVNAFSIFPSTGTITSGTVRLYGVAK